MCGVCVCVCVCVCVWFVCVCVVCVCVCLECVREWCEVRECACVGVCIEFVCVCVCVRVSSLTLGHEKSPGSSFTFGVKGLCCVTFPLDHTGHSI